MMSTNLRFAKEIVINMNNSSSAVHFDFKNLPNVRKSYNLDLITEKTMDTSDLKTL